LKTPLLYRVHEEPAPDKLDALREVAQASGLVLAKGQVLKTRHLNQLLSQAEGTDADELINLATLRSMTQAYYAPENLSHFGLALRSYAHFTSPIRRYSDLVVHRALVTAHRWGKDGLTREEIEHLDRTAQHISETERRSMAAERDTTDRYLAAYLSERVGTEMTGRISGIARFGAFVKLDDTGADGLIPIRAIGREFFHFDQRSQTLMGADTGLEIGLGQRVTVRLSEAVPVTGGLILELLDIEGRPMPSPPKRGGKRTARAPARKRKVTRRRR
jgi:ribonuclease R